MKIILIVAALALVTRVAVAEEAPTFEVHAAAAFPTAAAQESPFTTRGGATREVFLEAPIPQTQPAGQTAQLRELAERLLLPPYPSPDGQGRTAHLLPGQLPDTLPLALPVPPGSRLVGSAPSTARAVRR